MKSLFNVLIPCLSLAIISCNNDTKQTSPDNQFKSAGPGYEYILTCEGGCEVETNECTHELVGLQTYECNCDDCYFVIELVGEDGLTEEIVKGDAAISLANDLFQGYEHGFLDNFKAFLAKNKISEESIVSIDRSILRRGGFFGIRYEIKDNLDVITTVSYMT